MNDIIKTYEKSNLEYFGNSNSLHKLGLNSKKLEDASVGQILDVLGLKDKELIFTSGNCESYSLIFNNISNDKKIVTDNNEFFDIGKKMNKNIVFDKNLNVDKDVYLLSTCNDIDLSLYNCLKHVSLKTGYKNYKDCDYITIEDEMPFFGCLIKDKNKILEPIIHGGKSTTKYRSGTAATSLIVCFAKLIKNKYKK